MKVFYKPHLWVTCYLALEHLTGLSSRTRCTWKQTESPSLFTHSRGPSLLILDTSEAWLLLSSPQPSYPSSRQNLTWQMNVPKTTEQKMTLR